MKLPRAHHLDSEILAGQVLIPALDLEFINRNSDEAKRIFQLVREFHVTGFILFGGHPADVRYWTDFLQKKSEYPLLFAADLERGLKSVFTQGTMFPHNLCFGAAGNKQLVADFAEVVAKEARSVGINTIFAPVLDLADDPQNPIINIRAWHSDPEVVAEYGQLFIETVQKYGIACVAKHFPGHRSTQVDSHVDLPVLKKTLDQLMTEDLIPFKKSCKIGVKGIMAGHLKIKEFERPASMEPELVWNILRDQWRFDGVVFTDAIEMGAIKNNFKFWQQTLYPVEAVADILLMPQNFMLSCQILQKEIKTNEKFRRKVEGSVERIFRLKKWIHKQQPAQAHPYRIHKVIEHPDHVTIANKVAEEGITLLHKSNRFPIDLSKIRSAYHIIFTDTEFKDQPLRYFCNELNRFFNSVEIFNNPTTKNIGNFQFQKESVVIISIYFRTFAGHSQTLNWKHVNEMIKGLRKFKNPIVIFLFGNPYQIENLAKDHGADAVFLTYSYLKASQLAAFKGLCSFIKIDGKLPVELTFHKSITLEAKSYVLKYTSRGESWRDVDKIVESAIKNKIFPGGVVLAAQKGNILFHQAYGWFDCHDKSPTVELNTIYDLASLTKVLAATLVVMKLIENNEMQLEQKLADFYPNLEDNKKIEISIADLLLHQSGLQTWIPFYENFKPDEVSNQNRSIITDQILNTPLEYKTGTKAVYSDLGFILLLDIIEKVNGVPLDIFCRDQIFQPMGLTSLQFNPSPKNWDKIPPTGKDQWRNSTIQGVVNDNNCFAMGGISAHAGLFGTAQDVAAIGQMFSQEGLYNKGRHFKQKTIELFSQVINPKISNRALGWDTTDKNSSSGKFFSKQTIGHLGFTGCSLWVDLKKEIIIVLLCNRIQLDPKNEKIKEFRPILHDAVMRKIVNT